MEMLKTFFEFIKLKIVLFGLAAAALCYGIGLPAEKNFEPFHLIFFLFATFCLSAGSLGLNQVQEQKKDRLMDRTKNRPLLSGKLSQNQALVIAFSLIFAGSVFLYLINLNVLILGLLIVFFYNILYTYFFKPKLIFGAVPGAIPGAIPALMGYAAINGDLFRSTPLYLFLILFLWQMPHFWALAIYLQDDYKKADFPIMPSKIGTERTMFHILSYLAPYLGLALLAPFFVDAKYFYLFLAVPFVAIIMWKFKNFWSSQDKKVSWRPFFLWINLSIVVFLLAPLLDKWHLFFTGIVK